VRDLVTAFAIARADLVEWQLLIAGWGPGAEEVAAEIERRRLGGRVLALGARHDVDMLISRVDHVVRLDDGDVNGLSVIDALAAGVPVAAASTVPAAARWVRHDRNGWLLEQADPTAVADGLRSLADPSVAARLRAGARSSAADGATGRLTPAALAELRDVVRDTLAAPGPDAAARARR
jgi:glycosyltransferase involved in cell wall biosynthesis